MAKRRPNPRSPKNRPKTLPLRLPLHRAIRKVNGHHLLLRPLRHEPAARAPGDLYRVRCISTVAGAQHAAEVPRLAVTGEDGLRRSGGAEERRRDELGMRSGVEKSRWRSVRKVVEHARTWPGCEVTSDSTSAQDAASMDKRLRQGETGCGYHQRR